MPTAYCVAQHFPAWAGAPGWSCRMPDGLPAAQSDPRRIAAVLATGLLDTEPEQSFDDLAEVAAAITGCERAFITLVDEERSFWKACVGVDIQQTEAARTRPGKASAISWSDWATGSWSRTLPRTRAPVITPLSRR